CGGESPRETGGDSVRDSHLRRLLVREHRGSLGTAHHGRDAHVAACAEDDIWPKGGDLSPRVYRSDRNAKRISHRLEIEITSQFSSLHGGEWDALGVCNLSLD